MRERGERLVAELGELEVDAVLVTELVNVRYLTGYTGSNGLALVGGAIRAFVTDFRYVEQAATEVDSGFERIRGEQDLLGSVPELLSATPDLNRLAFDDAHVSVRAHARLQALLARTGIELVPAGGLVERLRRVKEPAEVERIAEAARLADEAFEELMDGGLVGRTESELALVLETAMRRRGASGPSFPPIIAGGAHGALPHAEPRAVPVERDQLVVIDWGALLDGYCSDCTRTVATGTGLDGEAREAYELVLAAQLAGLDAVAAGRVGADVDAVAREVITRRGHGEHFGHGLGHGVGLDIHEAPRLGQRSEDVLAAGEVVTVEPGVYLPGRFGVRIEDLLVVGAQGSGENRVLTSVPKELRVVG